MKRILLCVILLTAGLNVGESSRQSGDDGKSPQQRFPVEHGDAAHHDSHKDHEAFLGSKKEAEEFDQLPPEESKRRLRLLANKMDADGDGFVDNKELTEWVFNALKHLDREEAESRFKEIDLNADGFLTPEEYKVYAESPASVSNAVDSELSAEDKIYFTAADEDRDSRLNKEEYAAFLNPENHPRMHEAIIDGAFKTKDTDSDGGISLEEFLGKFASRPESEWHQIDKDRFTAEFDRDKNGILDRDEVRTWLIPDLPQIATEEAEHLISEADADKDGKLSIDEIVDEHELFVGSEATNYGSFIKHMREEL